MENRPTNEECALCRISLVRDAAGRPTGTTLTQGMEGPKVLVCNDSNGCRRRALERVERLRNQIHLEQHSSHAGARQA